MNELEQFLALAGAELPSSLARALCGFLEDCDRIHGDDPEPDGATDAAFATLSEALNAWTTKVHHYRQPNKCSEGCLVPRCGHLLELVVQEEPRDRCLRNLPMWDQCEWHSQFTWHAPHAPEETA